MGLDGRPLTASNGITFRPDFSVGDDPAVDYIVVCSGGNADQLTANPPIKWIRNDLVLAAVARAKERFPQGWKQLRPYLRVVELPSKRGD